MKTRRHKIRRVVQAVYANPWAIEQTKLASMLEFLDLRQERLLSEHEIRARIGYAARPSMLAREDEDDEDREQYYALSAGGVAVIPVYGVLSPRVNLMSQFSGGTSTQRLSQAIAAALADPQVNALVLDVDSPGGNVYGIQECAELLHSTRNQKPSIAVANHEMCSAAYWIGSAASEVVVSPSASAGSIGVYSVYSDQSEADKKAGLKRTILKAGANKAAGNPYEPMTDEARSVLQEKTDDYYRAFVAGVAANRGVDLARVERDFGQGKTMGADRAVAAGLADRVDTLDAVLSQLSKRFATAAAPALPARAKIVPAGGSSLRKVFVMDRTRKLLVSLGLVAEDASDAVVQAAVAAWFRGQGKPIPTDQDALLQALSAASTPATPPATAQPAVPPPAAGSLPAVPAAAMATITAAAAPLAPSAVEHAVAAERARVQEIRARGQLLGVEASTIDQAINAGASIEQFNEQAIRALAARQPSHLPVQPAAAATDKFGETCAEVLFRRCGYGTGAPSPAVRALQHRSLLFLAEESLRMSGNRTPVGNANDLARAALGDSEAYGRVMGGPMVGQPYQSPGDFPNILSGLANRLLDAAPRYVGTTFQNWAYRRPSVPDRRPQTLVRIGEFGEFPLHEDADNFESSRLAEEVSWIAVDEYGDSFALSPMMIEHDDLGAFMEALRDKKAAHDQTLNRLLVNLLIGNVSTLDGYSLFGSEHGNDVTPGAPPSTAQIAGMRLKMRKFTGVGGRQLNYTINRLLVPEELETGTEKLLRSDLGIWPTTEANVPLFKGRCEYDVEPMLSAASLTGWYGFMDPSVARAIVYCYQQGYEDMVTTNWYNPANHCRVWDFCGRFAGAVNTHRGVVRNVGTGTES